MFVTRKVWMKYHNQNDGSGNDLGGGGGGSEETKPDVKSDEVKSDDETKPDTKAKTGPSDEEARLLKENMKKKEELRKAQEQLDALKKQFDGIDPEAVRKLLADQKDAETRALEAKGDYERLKQRMAEEHGKEIKTLKEQLEALQAQLGKSNGVINELTIGTQFGQSKFISDELTLTAGKARVIYGDYFDLEDGKVVGYDKPRGSANRTALVDQYGAAVPFDAALRKIVEADPEKDHLLRAKIKPGANSDSRKPSSDLSEKNKPVDSVSKIAAGLGILNVKV